MKNNLIFSNQEFDFLVVTVQLDINSAQKLCVKKLKF